MRKKKREKGATTETLKPKLYAYEYEKEKICENKGRNVDEREKNNRTTFEEINTMKTKKKPKSIFEWRERHKRTQLIFQCCSLSIES